LSRSNSDPSSSWQMQNMTEKKYALSLSAPTVKELRRLPAGQFTGNAGGVVQRGDRAVCAPASPYETFASGRQNDVPLLIGSNAEEARAIVDVSHDTAAGFANDLERSVGQIPPALIAAYPHATDEAARRAHLDLERDLRFGWDMWAWARLQAGTGQSPVFDYTFRQQPPFPAGSVYAGWGASHYAELWYALDHLDQSPWNWTAADRRLAEEMSSYWVDFARSGDPNGPDLPLWPAFTNAGGRVQYFADPITVEGVANIKCLTVFDSVYNIVRGKQFAVQNVPLWYRNRVQNDNLQSQLGLAASPKRWRGLLFIALGDPMLVLSDKIPRFL